ncbi:MAG: ABC transporter substrate-binding protein, partial [Desulfobulbus sp.]
MTKRISPVKRIILCTLFAVFLAGTCQAADKAVRFVSVSWTGVTIKTELAVHILKALGYKTSNVMVSVPIVYNALATGEADVFLGNWMPSMQSIAGPYFEKGTVEQYVANMPGATYTLAVPAYVYQGGLQHFSDIAKYGDKLGHRIYGIEEGNDGNEIIQAMIDKNMFGLKGFTLVSSSEQGMLSQVQAFGRDKKWIVFLGWAPHYMNEIIDMRYLSGSTAETFGENDGTATVYTNIRKGFTREDPNVARFLKNLTFPVAMINQIMGTMHKDSDLRPAKAGLDWLKQHPEIYTRWLEGVKTVDGKPALPVFA